ncbi:hypothetical protein Tco_0175095 [Tanacetum coccineum]
MATHNRIYIAPSHTKKIFANMRRQGKDFSRRETPLFPTMMVQAQEEMGEGSAMPTNPHHTPIITQPSSSQPQRKQKSRRRPKEKDTEIPQSSVPSDRTNIADEAVTEEPKKKGGSRTYKLKRLYKIGRSARVVSSDEASLGDQEDASKQGRKIDDIDADAEITLVDESHGRRNDDLMFDTCVLNDEEVFAGQDMAKKEVSIVDPVTTAGAVDKVKYNWVEEPLKMKKKDQIRFDEQEAIRLQAEFDEKVRRAKEKDEANVALIEEWNDI